MAWMEAEQASAALGISMRRLRKRGARGAIPTRPHPEHAQRKLYEVHLPTEPAPPAATLRPWRILSAFDWHVPEHDEAAVRAFLALVDDVRPNEVIIGGDFLDLEAASQHGGVAQPRALVDEARAAREVLRRLRAAAPRARLIYLEGNHETRIPRIVTARLPTFAGALSVPELLRLADIGCAWVPYGEIYWPRHPSGARSVGGYTHGIYHNQHHAKMHADRLRCWVRYGHLHTHQAWHYRCADGTIIGGICTPALRQQSAGYVVGPSGWLAGCGDDTLWPDGGWSPATHIMHGHRLAVGGRTYGG